MRRLRATLARSTLDREIAVHVTEAERALVRALQACRAGRPTNRDEIMRQKRVLRDLERAAMAVSSVGSTTPRFDMSDPDLNPDTPPKPSRKKPEAEAGDKS